MAGTERENLSGDPRSNPYAFIEFGKEPVVTIDPESGFITELSNTNELGAVHLDSSPTKSQIRRIFKRERSIRALMTPDAIVKGDYARLFISDENDSGLQD